ncbi:HAD hydrolase-like protein [Flectobacillus major]|uniref:HAD hydrolase-like protein n=1 Tax=Flectobacillus major TaxID=103 RepID=UPI0004132E69|nr:HAD hydrolase-like protein [Flectobacillus major]
MDWDFQQPLLNNISTKSLINTSMNPIELVVFDMAGTTVQDRHEVEVCFMQAAARTGLSVTPERVLALQGYAKKQVFEMLWTELLGENHPDIQGFVDVSYIEFCSILENHYIEHDVVPTEGCLEIFDYLRSKQIKIALTTGFYRKVANIILQKLGWLQHLNEQYLNIGAGIIDLSVTSDDVERGRPEPLMIQYAMNKLGVQDSKRVINIGDTPSDLKSGMRAGCRLSLGVTNGTHTRQQLTIHRNDGLLPNVLALKPMIEAIESKVVSSVTF